MHSSGVGMDESNLQQNWAATKDTAAEEIKASKHFEPMKDIVARAKKHQSKVVIFIIAISSVVQSKSQVLFS